MNRFVLVVVGVVFQPAVIHNIDGLILSALKYILSCYVLKWYLKTNNEIPLPSLLLNKSAEDVNNRILGIKGQVSRDLKG